MLGLYENFPLITHKTETYTFSLSKRGMQQKIIQTFQKVNSKTFCFEEIGTPTVPNATVIFELGIAEADGFTFLNAEEAKRIEKALEGAKLRVMDWFCAIRYYKNSQEKKVPLKFDYYLLRIDFVEKGTLEFAIAHERGPRYLGPEDIITFLEHRINQASSRKALKHA